MNTLSKTQILSLLQCPKRLWLELNRPELAAEDDGVQARMEEGIRVGEAARSLFQGGLLVEGRSMDERVRLTEELLHQGSAPLFEATFQHKGVRIKADILLPQSDGLTLVEVKSAASVKPYYLFDITLQAWVLRGLGLNVRKAELFVINNQFVYPGNGDYRGLFAQQDVSQDVLTLMPETEAWVDTGIGVAAASDEPDSIPAEQCTDPFICPFNAYCAPVREKYPVETLPHIRAAKAKSLREKGCCDIRDIPDSERLSAAQLRVLQVTKAGRAELSQEATSIVRSLAYPRWYMDFETIAFAVPEWAGTRPYQQIPFQWSCHREEADGSLKHFEFLADGDTDPRRAFAESLIACIGEQGPVLVYNAAFESRILRETAETFPDLAEALSGISGRIFDLLPVARDHYYHPDMHGSWSIKSVLPTIAPELDYANLAVSNGVAAQIAFQKMITLPHGSSEQKSLRKDMLAYCEQDTFAMIALMRFFSAKGGARG